MMKTIRRKRQDRNDLDFHDDGKNIIEALENTPPAPYDGTDWHIPPPIAPVKEGRPELHITGPQLARPYAPQVQEPPPAPRPVFVPRARLIRLWKGELPWFWGVTKLLGFRAFMPVPRPRVKGHPALSLPPGPWLHTVTLYSDKTMDVICSQYETARAELFDDARAYDTRELELRSQHPLSVY